MHKLGVIGLGRMGAGIVKAVIDRKMLNPEDIIAFDVNRHHCERTAERGVYIASSNVKVAQNAPLILLAVKPQRIDDVLVEIQAHSADTCFISILAGIPSGYIKSRLLATSYVVSVMPNTPLMVGKAATVISKPVDMPLEYYRAIVSIFSAVGDVVFLDEEQINATIPIGGSAPAFFYRVAGEMLRYAEESDIDGAVAMKLIAQSMEGAAAMLRETGKSPRELIEQVASPGGTTLAALTQMDIHGFDDALRHAFIACRLRADELSSRG
ncbi:MAG: pyrroline-5-carboxylate reductase [Oscillospiraceae bacterium]|nr:pyrroline-5-carboxylate reductase [Oscillospiraceae bacterium]